MMARPHPSTPSPLHGEGENRQTRYLVGARYIVPLLAFLVLASACAAIHTPPITKIALLAPFEGRYREVGYEALYAARLALADVSDPQIELLAVDDGGTEAASRARALTEDPQVAVVLALGYAATAPETLSAFGDLPVLAVGDWGAEATGDNVFILSSPAFAGLITVPPRISLTDAAALPNPRGRLRGGEVFGLAGYAKLHDSNDVASVISSGVLPDAEFVARYRGEDPFAPEPRLLATLTYDATRVAVMGAQTDAPLKTIAAIDYDGINGAIHFTDGCWCDAPVHFYYNMFGVLVAY